MSGLGYEKYDRQAASRILAGLAATGLFAPIGETGRQRIAYAEVELRPEPDSHLTFAQLGYLQAYMRPCSPEQVTSATHRISWDDSEGIPNSGHYGPSGFGPIVPIAVRETVLHLWRELAASPAMAGQVGEDDEAVLAATTTDQEPLEIFRVGIEATGRALTQHALIADQTPYETPEDFVHGLVDSGIFQAVASQWYWELQASTYRRGMIPVSFVTQANGTVRYSPRSLTTLRQMKEQTIAAAHTVMRRATTVEGLTVADAVQKYYHDLDEISKQYALMGEHEQPRCLAAMSHVMGDEKVAILPIVLPRFVAEFVRQLSNVDLVALAVDATTELITDPQERIFHVPDMNCKHCISTITGLLESMNIVVLDSSLVTKKFTAGFHATDQRERAFDAIRNSGYTVIPPGRA
ncbi:heavy-metal-associated domain-containing protein [Fodinicola feengrottensis]|uniref:Copper chaperone n=1 Tax=Fodinicola feengrottensis TaxID=435914 RepID=A0ABN2GH80_9ACTN|nr:heavy-metal-associated domain-containing protein [Fodinicola feengrottensis]